MLLGRRVEIVALRFEWDAQKATVDLKEPLKWIGMTDASGWQPPVDVALHASMGYRALAALHDVYDSCILVCMRTTLNIDDELLERASELTGIEQKTALVRAGLEALISRASSRRLAELGGAEKRLGPISRRRQPRS